MTACLLLSFTYCQAQSLRSGVAVVSQRKIDALNLIPTYFRGGVQNIPHPVNIVERHTN